MPHAALLLLLHVISKVLKLQTELPLCANLSKQAEQGWHTIPNNSSPRPPNSHWPDVAKYNITGSVRSARKIASTRKKWKPTKSYFGAKIASGTRNGIDLSVNCSRLGYPRSPVTLDTETVVASTTLSQLPKIATDPRSPSSSLGRFLSPRASLARFPKLHHRAAASPCQLEYLRSLVPLASPTTPKLLRSQLGT